MLRIAVHENDKYGFVQYDVRSQELLVTHPSPKTRKKVYEYLTTTRKMDEEIPPVNQGDTAQHIIIYVTPTDNAEYVEKALCEMFFNIGVHVDWGHEHNKTNEIKI